MHPAAPAAESSALPSIALRRFAWAVLAYFIAVILWGGVVRATGSGAGCGDHWPLCNGTVVQHSPQAATIIEFTHRVTSGISFFAAVGLLIWTFAGTRKHHLARTAAVAAVVFTIFEASLGAALSQDFSAKSGWLLHWRWSHPAIALLAGIFLAWLLVRASRPSPHWDNRRLVIAVLALLGIQYGLGVLDVLLLAPVWLQIAHLLGADLLWSAMIVLAARFALEPNGQRVGSRE
jgi:heme A synthase